MKKNDKIYVTIEGYSSEGYGVAKPDGYVLFIPGTLRGEKVLAHVLKVGKSFGFAKVESIIDPSPERIDPKCPTSRLCGGCELWHMSYNEELELKRQKVLANLRRVGVDTLEILHMDSVCGYRNKAQYPVREQNGQVAVGFYRRASHDVIEGKCEIQPDIFESIAGAVKTFIIQNEISAYNEQNHRGVLRHIYLRGNYNFSQILLCLVVNGQFPLKNELISQLCVQFPQINTICINYNYQKDNVILGDKYETIYGQGYITDTLCGKKFQISPQAFYQVNHNACEILYKKVREFAATDNLRVLDLYCGIGTIGICAAENANALVGVEIVEQAVKDATKNAALNGLQNARFFQSDATGVAKLGLGQFDVIIVDPPRRGCDNDVLEFITAQDPQRLVYVSCDSATLARDCEALAKGGFKITKAVAVDMFPRTKHVETVVLMSRVEK